MLLTFLGGRVRSKALAHTSRSRFCVLQRRYAQAQRAQGDDIDWMKVGQMHVSELPDMEGVDEQEVKKGEAWWKSVVYDDVFADEKEISSAIDKKKGSEQPSSSEMFLKYPLPEQPFPADMAPVAVSQRLHRYSELLTACIKAPSVCTRC